MDADEHDFQFSMLFHFFNLHLTLCFFVISMLNTRDLKILISVNNN